VNAGGPYILLRRIALSQTAVNMMKMKQACGLQASAVGRQQFLNGAGSSSNPRARAIAPYHFSVNQLAK